MGVITRYRCDHCGHEQDRDRKFDDPERWMRTVTLLIEDGSIDRHGSTITVRGRDTLISQLWCHVCLGDIGVTRLRARTDPEPEPTTPTFEDMLRDIVRQEIEERG